MKIAFLGPAYPLRGGIAQFIAILADMLRARGHEVKIFSFKKQYPKVLFPGENQIDKSKLLLELPIQANLIPYNPLTFNKTVKEISAYKPDLLILKYWIPFFAPAFGYICKKIKKQLPLKILYIIDNIDFHEKWIAGKSLTRYALKNADHYITMSDSVYNSLKQLLPDLNENQISQLKHPTYSFYATKQKDNFLPQYNILFFGYIKPYKGLDVLLEAMPLILKSIPQLKLTIAGEVYGDKKPYFHLIEKHKLSQQIDFKDEYISNEMVEELFLGADLCVLPYKHATQSGIIQLSYAFGVPVLASDVGGIPEVVEEGKTGHLFPVNDSQALAKRVIEFYKICNLEHYQQHIDEENKKYSWNPFLKEIETL